MRVHNVNYALPLAVLYFNDPTQYREISPRGILTREFLGPWTTVYEQPCERVLFSEARDANPFFHLFESLWILAGRQDVKWLEWFLPRIKDYSDDGEHFHGAYGQRALGVEIPDELEINQVREVINELKRDPDSRRAVIALWQPALDSGYTGKDMPCNTTVYFKIRDGRLNMTVCNRSNDMVWGAYGANVVQFSTLQEYVAAMIGVPVGEYVQFSDSFHVYPDQEAWKKIQNIGIIVKDPYSEVDGIVVRPYPLVSNPETFDEELRDFMAMTEKHGQLISDNYWINRYFPDVAIPMYNALVCHRNDDYSGTVDQINRCQASDWSLAARAWVDRRHA